MHRLKKYSPNRVSRGRGHFTILIRNLLKHGLEDRRPNGQDKLVTRDLLALRGNQNHVGVVQQVLLESFHEFILQTDRGLDDVQLDDVALKLNGVAHLLVLGADPIKGGIVVRSHFNDMGPEIIVGFLRESDALAWRNFQTLNLWFITLKRKRGYQCFRSRSNC